jgi:hypothetical protein
MTARVGVPLWHHEYGGTGFRDGLKRVPYWVLKIVSSVGNGLQAVPVIPRREKTAPHGIVVGMRRDKGAGECQQPGSVGGPFEVVIAGRGGVKNASVSDITCETQDCSASAGA